MAHVTRRLVAIPALGLATSIALAPAALAQEQPDSQQSNQSSSQSNYNETTQSNTSNQSSNQTQDGAAPAP